MGVFSWIAANWLDVLQSLGIVSGFVFTAHTILRESKARKIDNLISLGQHHHAIWSKLHGNPALSRISDERADLVTKPLSDEERAFVTEIIVHQYGLYCAAGANMFVKTKGMQKDIQNFFSLPIPKAVWNSVRSFQDEDFVTFIECSELDGN